MTDLNAFDQTDGLSAIPKPLQEGTSLLTDITLDKICTHGRCFLSSLWFRFECAMQPTSILEVGACLVGAGSSPRQFTAQACEILTTVLWTKKLC